MKKKTFYIILIVCIVISATLLTTVIIPNFKAYREEKKYQEQLKNATIIVDLKDEMSVSFLDQAKVSDFIVNINGEIINDYYLDTSEIGEMNVNFEYVNDEDIKIPYSYKVNVLDDVAPVIWLGSSYSVTTNYDGDLLEDIVCADNYDDNPVCEIIGDYDTSKVGNYSLVFKATDASLNVTEKPFTLYVNKPSNSGNNNDTKRTYTYFSDVVKQYKTDKTKIGIDVSSWQGDINFEAVKDAGVEFVFIRVGSTKGINGEYFVDKTFEQNIEGFNKVGIPVGIYFYTYANSREAAIRDANWVLNQIDGYKIELPIAYDWESFSFYNEFHQSFYSTTKNAKAFLDTVKEKGYDGLLYSSKNYLEKVWYDTGYDVWLAHYTSQTTYQGDYKYWQMCSNGVVDGIYGAVDINIMYE